MRKDHPIIIIFKHWKSEHVDHLRKLAISSHPLKDLPHKRTTVKTCKIIVNIFIKTKSGMKNRWNGTLLPVPSSQFWKKHDFHKVRNENLIPFKPDTIKYIYQKKIWY